MTELETELYNALLVLCDADFSAGVVDLSEYLDIEQNTVKGGIGSLVKKGKVFCEQEKRGNVVYFDLFPMDDEGNRLSWGEWT